MFYFLLKNGSDVWHKAHFNTSTRTKISSLSAYLTYSKVLTKSCILVYLFKYLEYLPKGHGNRKLKDSQDR